MSDSIENSDSATPRIEDSGEPAPPSAPEPAYSPAEPPPSTEHPAEPAPEVAAADSGATVPVSPYRYERAVPAEPEDPAPPSFSAPSTPPAEAVPPVTATRPIEPITTTIHEGTRPVAPVPPPQRVHYYPAPTSVPEPAKVPSRLSLAAVGFGGAVLGALLVLGGLFAGGVFDEDPVPSTTTAAAISATPTVTTSPAQQVVIPDEVENVATLVGLKVEPSIVTVEVGAGNATSDFTPVGSGSGVVLSADGYIVTNNHVVDAAPSVRVIFQDGRIYGADVVGTDSLTDLAVLKIGADGLTPIELGATTDLQIGERAIAVGNPLGLEGGPSLTVGVVSAFDRQVDTGDTIPLVGMLQTDAPITNGSSGGALVDSQGKLIGITTAIGVSQAGAEGIGFAIPVEVVTRITDQIIANGAASHPFLGVSLDNNFEILEDGSAVPSGSVIVGFTNSGRSAAQEAGLEIGDVILSWNGNDVVKSDDLVHGIRAAAVGDTVTIVVDRGGETLTFDVVLGERPEGV